MTRLRFNLRSAVAGPVAMLAFAVLAASAQAQGSLSGSLSPNFSQSLSDNSQTSGFNSSFDASTANLTNPDAHSDVSDDTHSQVLGSTLSPIDNAVVSAGANSTPQTNPLSSAQAAYAAQGPYFGGRRSHSFNPGNSTSAIEAASAARANAMSGFGGSSMQAAFTGVLSSRAAFSGQSAGTQVDTQNGFSGQGVEVPVRTGGIGTTQSLSGIGSTQALSGIGSRDIASAYYATDPVLTNQAYTGDLGITGDMPSPTTQTGLMFASGSAPQIYFQYDDGQTPPITAPASPGQVLGMAPEYAPASNGFPDSTRGTAALADEMTNLSSPFASPAMFSNSPFKPVSDGTVYSPGTRFNPDLHTLPEQHATGSFQAFERRAQEQRITHGLSISQSSEIYQQDLRNYQQSHGRRQRPTLEEMDQRNRPLPGSINQGPSSRMVIR